MNSTQLKLRIESLNLAHSKKVDFWLAHCIDIRRRILADDDISLFLNWATIQATMYVGETPYIQLELDAVLEFYPSDILLPGDHFEEPALYNGMSTNLIHQAYHLLQYEKRLNIRVKELGSIIEFGGGYGAMALIVHRLGFVGDYYIYDYPEFSLLQEYYLDYQDIEVYHLCHDKKFNRGQYDLFIAIHSLNEIEGSLKRWRHLRNHPAMSYLFSYNSQWLGLDNDKWFKLFQQKKDNMEWVGWPIEHLPGRYYLVGAE